MLDAAGRLTVIRREYAGPSGRAAADDGFRPEDWTVRHPRARLTAIAAVLTAVCRRAIDIAAALVGLLLTLPMYPLLIPLVLHRAAGPLFYAARRQTRGGREFGCLKFRTMRTDADALLEQLRAANEVDGPQFKMARDPRVTPGGRILRATNLDELPQFFNVLAGDMSLIGPRPSPDHENRQCPAWREARLSVRPGISGLWQVCRSRDGAAGDFAEWIAYDTRYVRRGGLLTDLWIVLDTIPVVLPVGKLLRAVRDRLAGPVQHSPAEPAEA